MDFARYSDRHRTSLAHFLNKGKWNPAALEKALRESVIKKIYQHFRETKQPVLCIIDDTNASKTRPSSQAVHPMEATSNHMSHLKGRMDYGHQTIGVMLACGELVLNYAILLYDKSQLRSATGIRRFWLLMSLTHFLCCVGGGVLRSFSEGYAYWRTLVLRNAVQYIYNCGKNGMPFAMLGIG